MFESLKSLAHPSLFSRLKTKFFHKSEVARIKNILLKSFIVYLGLNIITGVAFYFDLRHFSTNITSSTPLPLAANTLGLSDLLLTSFRTSSQSNNYYNLLTFCLFAILFIQLELTVIWALLRSWIWRPISILGKIILSLIAQLLLIFPFLMLLLVPPLVIHNLQLRAGKEIKNYVDQLSSPTSNRYIITDLDQIENSLKESDTLPTLVVGDFAKQAILLTAKLASSETFYRGVVIPSVIYQTSFAPLPSPIYLFNSQKILISSDISKDQLSQVLTTYTLEIWNRGMRKMPTPQFSLQKNKPIINFVESPQYNQIQQTKLESKQKKILSYINEIKSNITQNDAYILDIKRTLTIIENARVDYDNRTQSLLVNCRDDNDEPACLDAEITVRRNLDEYDRQISTGKDLLNQAQNISPNLRKYLALAEQNLADFLKYPIIPEFQVGIFESPNTISIKYDNNQNSTREPLDYYYVLLHELAHYYTHHTALELPSFLEEGLADQLSLTLGQLYAPGTSAHDGYPEELKIAQVLSEKLGQDKLIQLYFDKSPTHWKAELDSLCGQGCYSQFIKIGNNLTFAPLDDKELRDSLVNELIAILSTP